MESTWNNRVLSDVLGANQGVALRLKQAALVHRASGGKAGGDIDAAQEPLIIDMAGQFAKGPLRSLKRVAQRRHQSIARGR